MTNPLNRMAQGRKRGRPSRAEMAERAAPTPVEPVVIETAGMQCIGCGRAIVPRVAYTWKKDGMERSVLYCPHCGVRFSVEDGMARRVSFPRG